jgi:DNA-directed RNA polymerase specialized sigma24 family protein
MVLKKCLEQVQREFDARVFRAFELYAVRGISVEEVCNELEISRNAVYIAKSRILVRLRRLAEQFEQLC